MQTETMEVYNRYGASPSSGCLPLLITLPIMIALYRIIYNIPSYVESIGNLFLKVAEPISALGANGEKSRIIPITDSVVFLIAFIVRIINHAPLQPMRVFQNLQPLRNGMRGFSHFQILPLKHNLPMNASRNP